MTAQFCPRDEGGFCRIALLGGECLVSYDDLDRPLGERCPKSEDEAHEMLVRAAAKWAATIGNERSAGDAA